MPPARLLLIEKIDKNEADDQCVCEVTKVCVSINKTFAWAN